MTLRLSIENMDRLPDGGPLRVEVRSRGLDIGRDAHLDWTLPDPSRYVSSKHCEVRFRDGGYWLHDVSTNGTFVNNSQFRLSEPYQLRDGDRLSIGQYIVAVEVKGGAPAVTAATGAPDPFSGRGGDPWGEVGPAAAPEDRRAFRNQQAAQRVPDFLDFAASVRPEDPMAASFAPPKANSDAWMTSAAPVDFSPAAEQVAAPTPRRPAERPPTSSSFSPPAPSAFSAPPSAGPPAPSSYSAPPPTSPFDAPPSAPSPAEPPLDWTTPAAPAASPPEPTPAAAVAAPPPIVRAPEPAPPPPVPPAPIALPSAAEPAAPAAAGDAADILRRLAAAAGIPQRAIAGRDPNQVIEEIGAALRISVENLGQMLGVRAESKSLMRSSSRTMIRARENNPLKFSATTEDALAIMFGAPSGAYLDARQTFTQSFSDIKNHQVLSGLATQAAIDELFEEFAPPSLEKSVEAERGIGAIVGSRKAKLWDVFVERWRLRTKRTDGRLNEAFATMFAEAYDRLLNRQ